MTTNDIVPGSTLTQNFGMTSYAKSGAYGGGPHTGWDLAAKRGTPVHIPVGVKSRYNGWEPGGYGNFVVIETTDGHQLWYGHFGQNRGEGFGTGNIAGYVGSSGNSTGPHCHFEVRKNGRAIDPGPYLGSLGVQSSQMPYTEAQYQDLFKTADLFNGYAVDGLFLRIIGRKATPDEMRVYKGLPIAERVKKLRESQAHRDAVNLVFQAAYGVPATDEDYTYPPRFEQDLPLMLSDLMGTQRHQEYVQSKKG